MALIGGTDVGATRQALVAKLVQEALIQTSILVPTVQDYSQFAVPGALSVGVPKATQLSVDAKAEDTDLVSQQITFTNDTISFDKHKAIYVEIEKIAKLQSNVDVQAYVVEEMAKQLALQIDKDLLVQLRLASAAAPDHRIALTGNIQSDIINARKLLNIQKVPLSDRYLVISPDQEAAMLAVADFVRADAYGSAGGLINGEIGRVYGFTVLMHTELAAQELLAYHKSHVGFAMQADPEYVTDFNLKGVKDEHLLDQLYGMVVLDSGKRGVLYNATGT